MVQFGFIAWQRQFSIPLTTAQIKKYRSAVADIHDVHGAAANITEHIPLDFLQRVEYNKEVSEFNLTSAGREG